MTTDEIIARLVIFSERLRGSVTQALCLNSTSQSLNENEEWRKAIAGSRVSAAANIVQHAVLRELILIIVRVLDKPRGKVEDSDKVSFPVISKWLERAEIQDELVLRGRSWFSEGYRADENEAQVLKAIKRLKDGLDRLAAENPNREERLRNFRDQFLAHELHFEIPRDKPLFGHIYEMLDEIRALSEAAALAIEGSSVAWSFVNHEMQDSADELWRSAAKVA